MTGQENDDAGVMEGADDTDDAGRARTESEGRESAGWHGWASPLGDLQDMMDDLVEGFRELSPTAYVRYPRIEIGRTPGGYIVAMDVPGVKREDLDLSAVGDQLTVRGERRRPEYPEGTRLHRSERSYGRFRRVIRLPADVEPQGIKARLEGGVLFVTLPRRGDDKGVAIEVEEI